MISKILIPAILASSLLLAGCCEPLPPRPTIPKPAVEPPDATEGEILTPRPDIPVVLLPSDDSNSVSFRFVFKAGSVDDPMDKRSVTALTARLIAYGGTEKLSYKELLEQLFPMSASIDVQVDCDQTVFLGRVHKDHLDDYYSLIRDVLLTPRLEETDFKRIRQEMLSDLTLALRGNDDEELGKAALSLAMYKNHPYGAPAIGTESGLSAICLEDVKVQRETVFCDRRLIIGLAGAVSKEFADKVEEDMKKLPRCPAPMAGLPETIHPKGRQVLMVDKPTAESTAISIGFPISVRRGDLDYPALKLVETYFGQHRNSSGVLYNAIREIRGFNYGDYAYVEHFKQDGWEPIPRTNAARREQYFSIWIRPVADEDKHFVLRLALFELEELFDKGISKEDFERIRTFMKRYYLTFAKTESRKLGYAVDDLYYDQDKPYFDYLFEGLDALNADKVNEVIRKYLTKGNLYIAIVTKNAEKLADEIAADTPTPKTYDSPKPDYIVAQDKLVERMSLSIPRSSITIIKVDDIFK
jgi:zinc protease